MHFMEHLLTLVKEIQNSCTTLFNKNQKKFKKKNKTNNQTKQKQKNYKKQRKVMKLPISLNNDR